MTCLLRGILLPGTLVLCYMLAACSSPPGPTPTPIVTASPVPGYTPYHSDGWHYSMQLAPDWQVAPPASVRYAGNLVYSDVFLHRNLGFFTSLTINGTRTNGTAQEVYAEEIRRAEREFDDVTVEDLQMLDAPAKLLIFSSVDAASVPIEHAQVIFVQEEVDKGWVMTLTTVAGQVEHYRNALLTMIGTFAPDPE
jgi:hypothetical protein